MKTPEDISRFKMCRHFTTALYGKKVDLDPKVLATNLGASSNHVCLVDCSKNPDVQIAVRPVFNSGRKHDVRAEGVLLTEPGSAAVIKTADCPTLILYDKLNRKGIINHAGRPALTPRNIANGRFSNIVTITHQILTENSPKTQLIAYITGSICGDCFLHDNENGRRLAEPFINVFGDEVMTEKHGLDLPLVIKKQLMRLGVKKENITHDEICTFENESLYSYRNKDGLSRNTVIFVLH
ncbi:MAG: polyphenol oxidase family protein [Candidatus Nomurabacteria bacterium]|nr:polyphenol oxidase family protein [Candidatus Nomurabacteria bacterium]USN88152.1 MAG: polyphenol oxidase family protein [Candidatus Nomurabacteria bacterium]